MRTYRLSPLRGRDGRWYLRMRAPNGQITLGAQQGYVSLSNARRAAMRLVSIFTAGRVKFVGDPWMEKGR